MNTPCVFPAQIVCDILCYTTVRDVVRWRRVSKWFLSITHEPKIWRILYVDSPFLRPPGPFSTLDFERAFIKSTELAREWTTQQLKTKSRITVPFKGSVTINRHLIDGRWFVVCQSNRFVLYDTSVDAETREPRAIWEQKNDIVAWDKYVTVADDGQWVVYLLIKTLDPLKCTLLEIRVDVETGTPCSTVTLDVPAEVPEEDDEYEPLQLDGGQKMFGRSPFLSVEPLSLIFDTRTRTFYELPKFRVALAETRYYIQSMTQPIENTPTIMPTNTHVIALYYVFGSQTYPDCVVQAFVVPDGPPPLENGKAVLQLSHEGAFSMSGRIPFTKGIIIFAMIQNSVINRDTDTTVKLLARDPKLDGFDSTCVTMTLTGEPSANHVGLIDVDMQRIFIDDDWLHNYDLHFCDAFYDISDDGYARGFFTRNRDCPDSKQFGVMKFTIDASQNYCQAVLGRFSRALGTDKPIDQLVDDANEDMAWDGVRGRLCYIEGTGYKYVEDGSIVVVDLA